MIERVLEALENKDYKSFSRCFSEFGRYFDYGPSINGKENYFCYGRDFIEMFFKNRFVQDHIRIDCTKKESETSGSYFAAYDGPYVYVRFEIEELDEDGLIKKAVVHPA